MGRAPITADGGERSQSAPRPEPALTLEVELHERSIAAVRTHRECERLEAERATLASRRASFVNRR